MRSIRIRYRIILSLSIGIDACGGGCIRFRTTVVGGLEVTVVLIVGSVAGATFVGRLAGTVVVFGRSAGVAVVVVVVGTGSGSTGV